MFLPNGGYSEEVIRTKVFEDYVRDHVDSWFSWVQKSKLGVERMEDLILVSSCTLVSSWAAATFVDNNMEAEISLASRVSNNVMTFAWSKNKGPVECRNSDPDQVRSPGYVYSACTNRFSCCVKRDPLWINASSSRASEQNAYFTLADESGLQQDPVLTILTAAEKMKYK